MYYQPNKVPKGTTTSGRSKQMAQQISKQGRIKQKDQKKEKGSGVSRNQLGNLGTNYSNTKL